MHWTIFFLFCFTCLFVFNVSAYAGVRWVCLICCLVFKKGISLKIQKLQISMLKFFMIIKWQGNKLKPLSFRSKKNWMFFFFFPLMTSCHWPLSSPEVPPWGTGNGINWLLWISVGDKWIWFGLFSFSQMKTENDWFQTVTKKKSKWVVLVPHHHRMVGKESFHCDKQIPFVQCTVGTAAPSL